MNRDSTSRGTCRKIGRGKKEKMDRKQEKMDSDMKRMSQMQVAVEYEQSNSRMNIEQKLYESRSVFSSSSNHEEHATMKNGDRRGQAKHCIIQYDRTGIDIVVVQTANTASETTATGATDASPRCCLDAGIVSKNTHGGNE